jgi:NitT/TauT family transport system substrate-binding protein
MKTRQVAAALAFSSSVIGSPALAADAVVFALPVVSLTVASVNIADDQGYWKSAGLDIQFPVIAGVGAINAVLASSADFSIASGPTMIRANAREQKLIGIATTLDRVQQEIVISKAVADAAGVTAASPIEKKAQAMRGKKIAVDSINSVVHSYLRFVARKYGIDPEREITVTSTQGPVMLAGLKNASIDGFVLSLPWTIVAVRDGSAISVASSPRGDFKELEPFTYTVVVAKPDTCDKKPTVCQRLVDGLAKAQVYMHDKQKESIAILQKRISGIDPQIFAEAYELVRASTPKSVKIDPVGMTKAQDYMVATGMMKAEEKLKSLEAIYTNRFVK